MICMWKELLWLLPRRLRPEAEKIGQAQLLEIRLRLGQPAQFICSAGSCQSQAGAVTREDLASCVQIASGYSAYAAGSVTHGFLTAAGGHRIGLCGSVARKNGTVTAVRDVTSLCVRVARDIPGIGQPLADQITASTLILGPPGAGKTTLLRDAVRCLSRRARVSVVDERGEIFPESQGVFHFPTGRQTDVLNGCPKAEGMDMVLRSMGPEWIAVDEITSLEDCAAMEACSYCGARFLATAHASGVEDLRRRPVYARLLAAKIFDTYAVLDRDRHYTVGRLTI